MNCMPKELNCRYLEDCQNVSYLNTAHRDSPIWTPGGAEFKFKNSLCSIGIKHRVVIVAVK